MQAGSAESIVRPDTTSLRTTLQNAAITIPQLLRKRAELHGDKLALREKDFGIWNRYSWSHYYETARSVALGLLSLGLKPGDRVAIAGEDTPEWFYADLGTQMIGAIAVGIYPTNPWVELQYIVRHSGARRGHHPATRSRPTRSWTPSPTMTACRRWRPSSAST